MRKAQIYIILALLLAVISFSYMKILQTTMFKGCDLPWLLIKERNILSIFSNIDYETFASLNFTNTSWNGIAISHLANWTYRYKIPIILREEGNRSHVNEVIEINVTFPQATDNCSIEIYCEDEKANYYIKNWTDFGTQINSTILFNFSLKPNSIKELSEATGRKPSNLSRTLKTLSNYGIVELIKESKQVKPIVNTVNFEILAA